VIPPRPGNTCQTGSPAGLQPHLVDDAAGEQPLRAGHERSEEASHPCASILCRG
jgi:hypothetical protein